MKAASSLAVQRRVRQDDLSAMRNSGSFRARAFYLMDGLGIALQSIVAHKLRSFLTLIGIIIGVASVAVVGASIEGMNTYVVEVVVKLLGVNHFIITREAYKQKMTVDDVQNMLRRNRKLDWADLEWLQSQCQSCVEVGAKVNASASVQYQDKEMVGVRVEGVTANMAEIEDKDLSEGRFFLPVDVEHSERACVIGEDLRLRFFSDADPLGQSVKIRGEYFRVIGIEARRGSLFGQSLDKNIYIPLTTFGRIYGRRQSLELHGKAAGQREIDQTVEQARMALRIRHKLEATEEDDFGLTNVEEVNGQVNQFADQIAIVVTPITLISLLVGGIVVMNMMLVTVTERRYEIGLRKAVGARRGHILLQFLIESALLTGLGGALGLLTAAAVTWLVSASTAVPMEISLFYILLSLLMSITVGMLAGIYPAYKAARLDPVTALAGI